MKIPDRVAADQDRIDAMLTANPYAVRHRNCGRTVRVRPTRQSATALVAATAAPLRHQLRVGRSRREDIESCLRQSLCPHVHPSG